MALTPGGLPYPLGTDKVVDGDDAIKALAEAIDAKLLSGQRVYGGQYTGVTSAAGSISVPHGMPTAPAWAVSNLNIGAVGDVLGTIVQCGIQTITPMYIEVRFVRNDTHGYLTGNPVTFMLSWGMKTGNT